MSVFRSLLSILFLAQLIFPSGWRLVTPELDQYMQTLQTKAPAVHQVLSHGPNVTGAFCGAKKVILIDRTSSSSTLQNSKQSLVSLYTHHLFVPHRQINSELLQSNEDTLPQPFEIDLVVPPPRSLA